MEEARSGRILLVSIGSAYGGAETYLVKLAELLLKRFAVAAVVNNKILAADFQKLGVQIFDISDRAQARGGRYLSAYIALREARRIFEPDVIHLNGQAEAYLALLVGSDVPILITRHTPLDRKYLQAGSRLPVWLKRAIVVKSLRNAQHVVCVSHLLGSQLARCVDQDRLSVIPTWLQTSTVAEPRRAELAPTPCKLLFAGRVEEVKGIFDLIDAVRALTDVTLDVVGDGRDIEKAKAHAAGLPVKFHGFQTNCRAFYDQADLLVFPSHEGFEGLPQVPLEAMGAGLPCLASDISAMKEILGESKCALLFRTGDVADLVRGIQELKAAPHRLTQLSYAGVARMASAFTVGAVAEQYERVFTSAIRSRLATEQVAV